MSASTLNRAFCVVLILLLASSGAFAQQAGRRVALVVGNSSYRAVERLANPANDAKLIAGTLQRAGFTLVGGGVQLDLDKARFDRAVQDFGRAVQGADVALFYYSGHGMQVSGTNWLVPIDANPTGDKDLDFQMVDAGLVLHQMEGAGTKLNLVVLDACRNNPFAVHGVRGVQSGLAEMHAPEGTLISYATQPGNVALDGSSGDSPYTRALADAIRRPGLDIFQVFNQVGLAVKQETAGNQQPWLASSPISGSFYFFNGPVTIAPGPAADPDTVFWQSISHSSNPADYQAYLRRYPNGIFSDLARSRSEGTAAALPAPPPSPSPAPANGATDSFRVMTAAGQEVRAHGHASWKSNCAPSEPPAISIVSKPDHGSVMTRPGTSDVTELHKGAIDCRGRTYPAVVVWYQPASGFRGLDQFQYEVVHRTSSYRVAITVDVR